MSALPLSDTWRKHKSHAIFRVEKAQPSKPDSDVHDTRINTYSVNYNDMTANRIDVVELACEEYSQEVLGFSDVIAKEADAFLALADDPTSPKVDESYYDPEGDILILEALLNSDPSPPPNQGNYLPKIERNLNCVKLKLPNLQ
ncbi:hypothetical protein Tco_0692110 [Tanacetum coccineum]